MSVGEKIDLAALTPMPDNFHVARFVNRVALLRNVDVFVTHGGLCPCRALRMKAKIVLASLMETVIDFCAKEVSPCQLLVFHSMNLQRRCRVPSSKR